MKKNMLLKEFATRDRMELYSHFTSCLPDPDKILCNSNYDYSILRDLLNDPHLIAAVQQRKMQVMQMGWEVDGYNGKWKMEDGKWKAGEKNQGEEIKAGAIEVMKNLPLAEIINGVLDSVLFGFSVGEIDWQLNGKEIVPVDLKSKPQEWFIFDKNNELMLRKKIKGSYIFEEGEKLPDYKFIINQYQPTYNNPYGEKVLSKCYWPVTFKRSGIEYWQLMMERFGMPYLIGRYGAGATDIEKQQLIDDLMQMMKDSVSVFEEGKQIEIKESPQYDIGQLYEKLVEFQNKEISKAVLTVTLTTETERSGSYKAAEIHKELLNYLGITDKKLVEKALNKLLQYYTILNFGNVPAPKVKLNKKEAVVDHSAERDKVLNEMGVKFTKEYYMKRYNLGEGDFELL